VALRVFGEAEFLRGGQEPGQVVGKRSRRQMTPEDGQFTADQIVIPGRRCPANIKNITNDLVGWETVNRTSSGSPAHRCGSGQRRKNVRAADRRFTLVNSSARGMRRAGRPLRDGRGVLC